MSHNLLVDISMQDGVTVVVLGSEYENLNEAALTDVQDALLEVSRTAEPPLVVLDLSHTTYFGTSFLAVLFRMWNRLRDRDGGRFAIGGVTPFGSKVLGTTHLNRVWNVFKSRDDAVRAILSR